jgi:hypothetical protein
MTTDERKAIEQVQAALGTLTPATARDDATAFDLRYAARFMTEAMANRYSGERHLNALRASGSNALSAVAVSLDRRTLTQNMIETARQAVAALLDQAPE